MEDKILKNKEYNKEKIKNNIKNMNQINIKEIDKQVIKINYQKELEKIIKYNEANNIVPTLLLHSCCGPCSSYVLEYLSQYFKIKVFYYNPNIYPSDEYWYRVDEQQKIIDLTDSKYPIDMVCGKYDTDRFYKMVEGMEDIPEGGARCHKCYELRLKEAAMISKKEGFDYFTTTLSISPHKNSQVLNKIGEKVGKEIGVRHLPSDFKKNNGYKRSCQITQEYNLYRQDYCGCEFSKRESEMRQIKKEKKELREYMKDIGKNLELSYMEEADKIISQKLFESEAYKSSKVIFTYIGEYPEINTKPIIEKALNDKKIVCVPYCVDKEKMQAYQINSLEELHLGKFNILEPDIDKAKHISIDKIDFMIIPCSTANLMGHRLGFGGGYYDRYIKNSHAYKVLLIRKKQISEDIPREKHDIIIENVISE